MLIEASYDNLFREILPTELLTVIVRIFTSSSIIYCNYYPLSAPSQQLISA